MTRPPIGQILQVAWRDPGHPVRPDFPELWALQVLEHHENGDYAIGWVEVPMITAGDMSYGNRTVVTMDEHDDS